MNIVGEKRSEAGTLPCDNCGGKTGHLYEVEKNEKRSFICTTCKSIFGLIQRGKGHGIQTMYEAKTGKPFKNNL